MHDVIDGNLGLVFEAITRHAPGLIERLLNESYQGLPVTDEEFEKYKLPWRQADRETFGNPETIGRCAFITTLKGKPIGFGSFDPRGAPAVGVIGQSCILPARRGHGFGKQQLEEILRQLQALGIHKAVATTGDHSFFAPAQKMYLACGFRETRRSYHDDKSRFGLIEYELDLRSAEPPPGDRDARDAD